VASEAAASPKFQAVFNLKSASVEGHPGWEVEAKVWANQALTHIPFPPIFAVVKFDWPWNSGVLTLRLIALPDSPTRTNENDRFNITVIELDDN
jgi:hypothetical protein